ncbi:hypothetical protein AVEN_194045-1 [Araneus ventricosus]|uniref:Uncharacterized protein n=1 Tax=Araneus ventricosus TaxID=182803 RepID=A0A4Y2DHM2_ARAVE|nr:hypothetical protein AVEN_194045-1 [Araneus ventricosus]
MNRTTPEHPLSKLPHHTSARMLGPLGMIFRATGPIHDGSSVGSGFEHGTLRPQSFPFSFHLPLTRLALQNQGHLHISSLALPKTRSIPNEELFQSDILYEVHTVSLDRKRTRSKQLPVFINRVREVIPSI